MSQNKLLKAKNTALNELQFILASQQCDGNPNCVFRSLMSCGLDDVTLGFWIWDIKNNIELYSPTFRSSLQYEGKLDFPDSPDSWQSAIIPSDKLIALDNFINHIDSKSQQAYLQTVTYNRKISGQIRVVCHGLIVKWDEQTNDPELMIGVHLPENGLFFTKS